MHAIGQVGWAAGPQNFAVGVCVPFFTGIVFFGAFARLIRLPLSISSRRVVSLPRL